MKHLHKLNQAGFDHVLAIVVFVVIFALAGSFLLVQSHASSWSGELQLGLNKSLCLDNLGNSKTAKSPIDIFTCNGSQAQSWLINGLSGKTNQFTIKAAAANLCVDDTGGAVGTSAKNQVAVETASCSTTDHTQVWEWAGTGNHELENYYSHGCINDPNNNQTIRTHLIVYACSATANMQWYEAALKTTGGGSSTGGGGNSGSTAVGCTSGGVAAPCIGSSTTGASGWGSPTFQSIFNGTSVNTSQWKVEGPTAPNNSQEYDCYSPSNVSEGGGTLSLKLTSTKCTVGGSSWPDTGAQMDTQSTFNQTYGYYEAPVYFPGSGSTVANWGAFWLTNENWPTDGEIDTVEGYHGTAGYHFEYAPSGSAIWQGGQASGNYTGWHIYGVNWQANAITFYYDGKEMGSYTTGTSYNDKPMFILLDYTTAPQNDVGGPSVVPDTMQVQYVRAWK